MNHSLSLNCHMNYCILWTAMENSIDNGNKKYLCNFCMTWNKSIVLIQLNKGMKKIWEKKMSEIVGYICSNGVNIYIQKMRYKSRININNTHNIQRNTQWYLHISSYNVYCARGVFFFLLCLRFDFERCAKTKWRNVDLFQRRGIHNFYLFIYFCFNLQCC